MCSWYILAHLVVFPILLTQSACCWSEKSVLLWLWHWPNFLAYTITLTTNRWLWRSKNKHCVVTARLVHFKAACWAVCVNDTVSLIRAFIPAFIALGQRAVLLAQIVTELSKIMRTKYLNSAWKFWMLYFLFKKWLRSDISSINPHQSPVKEGSQSTDFTLFYNIREYHRLNHSLMNQGL